MKIEDSARQALLAGACAAASITSAVLHKDFISIGITGGLALTLSLISIKSAMEEVTKKAIPQRPKNVSSTPSPGRSPP